MYTYIVTESWRYEHMQPLFSTIAIIISSNKFFKSEQRLLEAKNTGASTPFIVMPGLVREGNKTQYRLEG